MNKLTPFHLAIPVSNLEKSREQSIASGFLSIGPKMLACDDPDKMRRDIVDEQLDTTGRAFMGMTFGCARCHDHKYDPIPTKDYYQMLSAFTTTVRSDIDIDLSSMNPNSDSNLREKISLSKTHLKTYEQNELKKSSRVIYDGAIHNISISDDELCTFKRCEPNIRK